MDLLNHVLKGIEASRLGNLDLIGEAGRQILLYNPIGAGKEPQNIANKVLFILVQLDPVPHILAQVNLMGEPHNRLVVHVLLVQLRVLDGEEGEPGGIRPQDGFHEGILL